MNDIQKDVKTAEETFFSALVTAQTDRLESVLTDDFVLVDVMQGGVIPRSAFVDVVKGGKLKFSTIDPLSPATTRVHGTAAFVIGETRMRGTYEGQAWETHSRYTHAFVQEGGKWKMVSAQGTPIPG